MTRSVLRRAVLLLGAGAALALLMPAAPAAAHAYLTASNPADGADLAAAPHTLRLQFSESVDLPTTRIELTDAAGHGYPVHGVRIERGSDTEEPASVLATLPALPVGAYRVVWETLSSDDLHRTSGALAFGIRHAVSPSAFREPVPPARETALRWAVFLAIAVAFGGLLTRRLNGRAGGGPDVARRCSLTAAAGAGSAALLAVALFVEQATSSGASLGRLAAGAYGQRWLLREAGLLALLVAALPSGARGRIRIWLVVAGAGGVGLGSALLGHSAAGRGFAPTAIGADALHLLATATWSGTLVVAGLLALRSWATARAVLREFGRPAAACVGVAVVTGVYLASGVVGSVDAALLTWYGRALLLKVGLFAGAALVGLANHRRVRGAGGRRLGRGVAVEAVATVLVLGLAAFLTSGQPAREPRFVAQPRPAVVPFVGDQVADLQVQLRVGPNRPGRDLVLVDVFDTRRPSPAPVRSVVLRVTGGGPGSASTALRLPGSETRWSAPLTLPSPGGAGIEVTFYRAGLPAVRHVFRWVVAGAPQVTRPATVSTAPLRSPLRLLAGVLAVLLVAVGALVVARRPRRSGEPAAVRTARSPELEPSR